MNGSNKIQRWDYTFWTRSPDNPCEIRYTDTVDFNERTCRTVTTYVEPCHEGPERVGDTRIRKLPRSATPESEIAWRSKGGGKRIF